MTSVHTEQHCSYTMTKSLSVLEMLQETNTSTSLEQSLYLRPKKNYCCFRKHGQKIGSVGRFFTMVLISTLSYCTRFCLCCLLVTFYFDKFGYRKNPKNDLDMMINSWN